MIYLVRHARAGDRAKWEGEDRLRPLSNPGRRQAAGLVDQLKKRRIERVVSSPYARCVQSVEPLAQARKLEIEESEALAEGAGFQAALGLIKEVAGVDAVLCTHGDVIWELLDHLHENRVLRGGQLRFEEGSTWLLEEKGGRIVNASFLPPPEVSPRFTAR